LKEKRKKDTIIKNRGTNALSLWNAATRKEMQSIPGGEDFTLHERKRPVEEEER